MQYGVSHPPSQSHFKLGCSDQANCSEEQSRPARNDDPQSVALTYKNLFLYRLGGCDFVGSDFFIMCWVVVVKLVTLACSVSGLKLHFRPKEEPNVND
jgi:hypothetical protein